MYTSDEMYFSPQTVHVLAGMLEWKVDVFHAFPIRQEGKGGHEKGIKKNMLNLERKLAK